MGVLDGKVAIVTGSARGIGRATAELLGEHGAKVLINDLDADVAEQTASAELGGYEFESRRRCKVRRYILACAFSGSTATARSQRSAARLVSPIIM